jgi:hypothetical protein
MAAIARTPAQAETIEPHIAVAEPALEDVRHPMARLAALHAEAEETARLANLLGRSLPVAIAFAAMAALVLAFGGSGLAPSLAWAAFMLVASGAAALAYRRTISQPFAHAALKSFSQDFHAILVFAGFAWGAGAFLAIPAAAPPGTAMLFATGASVLLAVLLREREALFLFLAPTAALTAFACVLRPLPGSVLEAALVLLGCGAVAGAVLFVERRTARERGLPELAGLA